MGEATAKVDIEKALGGDICKFGFSRSMQKKWIKLSEESKEHVVRIAEKIEDSEKDQLIKFQENQQVDAHDKKLLD